MQLEPNLFYERDGIYARGFHDEVGKCFHIFPGSEGIRCENPKKAFFGLPNIQKVYENEISPYTETTGDDTHFHLKRDVRCYPMDNYDELSIAGSLMAGVLVKGVNVWKNDGGVTVRILRSKTIAIPVSEDTEENVKRYEDATRKTFDMISSKRSTLIAILSLAQYFKNTLGSKNEDRFIIPRHVDHSMERFGFECEEEKSYDLIIPGVDYTISDKMANNLFHQEASKKSRTNYIKDNLQMSNTRSGQSSDNHQRPQFDCLLVMQYIPFLVCGVVEYHKIASHFRHTDGGWILSKVPVNYFKYVISPTENVPAQDILPLTQLKLDTFVRDVQGGFMPKLIDEVIKIEDNTPIDQW